MVMDQGIGGKCNLRGPALPVRWRSHCVGSGQASGATSDQSLALVQTPGMDHMPRNTKVGLVGDGTLDSHSHHSEMRKVTV